MADTPNVSNSLTVRVQFKNGSGMLGRLASEIGQLGGDIGAVDLVSVGDSLMVRDLTINCRDDEHAQAILDGIRALEGFTLLLDVMSHGSAARGRTSWRSSRCGRSAETVFEWF